MILVLYDVMQSVHASKKSHDEYSNVCLLHKTKLQGFCVAVTRLVLQDDWSLFMITRKRTMKLRISEYDETFSEDFAEGTQVRKFIMNNLFCFHRKLSR